MHLLRNPLDLATPGLILPAIAPGIVCRHDAAATARRIAGESPVQVGRTRALHGIGVKTAEERILDALTQGRRTRRADQLRPRGRVRLVGGQILFRVVEYVRVALP